MSRYEHMIYRVPAGMNDNADPALFPSERASIMLGLANTYPGVASEALRTKVIFAQGGGSPLPQNLAIDCIFGYSGLNPSGDLLLIVCGGTLYKMTVSTLAAPSTVPDALHVTCTSPSPVTNHTTYVSPFATGLRIRAVQFQDEVIFTQDNDNGLLTTNPPVRFNGTALYNCGIVAPPIVGYLGGGAGNVDIGAHQYVMTYADEKLRESSPSPELTVTNGTSGGVSNQIQVTASADPQVGTIYLYRSTAGNSTWYRIATLTNANQTYTDSAADATISNNVTIRAGQNDPPLACTLIANWKTRVVLNSIADREVLQVSNLLSPTQYGTIGALAGDGITMRDTNQYGDQITAIAPIGSALGIWRRRGMKVMVGSQPPSTSVNPFQILDVDPVVGCTASDSVANCGNVVAFKSEDGVYSTSYDSGFQVQKLSGDMDGNFKSAGVGYDSPGHFPFTATLTRQSRDAAAIGRYMQTRYYLMMPPFVYVYDFERQGWITEYMTGMPYGPNDGSVLPGNSFGYESAEVVNVDRQYQLLVYAPGYPASTLGAAPASQLYVGSYYPLQPDNLTDTFGFVMEYRAADGEGVARVSRKRMKRISIFGEVKAAVNAAGIAVQTPQLSGTITLNIDGADVESAPFGITGAFAANYSRDQVQGKLIVQEWSAHCVGRVHKIRVQGTAVGRLQFRDCLAEYVRLDSGPA